MFDLTRRGGEAVRRVSGAAEHVGGHVTARNAGPASAPARPADPASAPAPTGRRRAAGRRSSHHHRARRAPAAHRATPARGALWV